VPGAESRREGLSSDGPSLRCERLDYFIVPADTEPWSWRWKMR
jgi:hypothetical protein